MRGNAFQTAKTIAALDKARRIKARKLEKKKNKEERLRREKEERESKKKRKKAKLVYRPENGQPGYHIRKSRP